MYIVKLTFLVIHFFYEQHCGANVLFFIRKASTNTVKRGTRAGHAYEYIDGPTFIGFIRAVSKYRLSLSSWGTTSFPARDVIVTHITNGRCELTFVRP